MNVQIAKQGFGACQGCGLHATLRSVDVAVPALAASKRRNFVGAPAGWAPLVALCGHCWDALREQLDACATPGLPEVGGPPSDEPGGFGLPVDPRGTA